MTFHYTKENVKCVTDNLEHLLTANKVAVERPQAILLGGQPGSGKSVIVDYESSQQNGNTIFVNSNDLRKYHPDYNTLIKCRSDVFLKETSEFANDVKGQLLDRFSKEGYNLVINGTLVNTTVTEHTNEFLRLRGYRTELAVMATNKTVSLYRSILKTEKMAAMHLTAQNLPQSMHTKAVSTIAQNLSYFDQKSLFDNIRVFNRNGECILDKSKSPSIDAGNFLEERINSRNIETDQEVQHLRSSIQQMQEMNLNTESALFSAMQISN